MAFTGSEILNDVTMMHMNNGIKRKRIEAEHQGMDDQQSTSKFLKKGKSFLTVSAQAGLYHTENWSGKDTAIFIPLNEDTTLRVHSFDQITYPSGSGPDNYFIGDAEERYTGTIPGRVIHLWRFSEARGRLFIARSLLCTDDQVCEPMNCCALGESPSSPNNHYYKLSGFSPTTSPRR